MFREGTYEIVMVRNVLLVLLLLLPACSSVETKTPAARACSEFSAFAASVHKSTVSHEHRNFPGVDHWDGMIAQLPLKDDLAMDRAVRKIVFIGQGHRGNRSYYGYLIVFHQMERLCDDRGYETPSVPSEVILEYFWCGKGGGMAEEYDYTQLNPALANASEGYDTC